MAIEPITENELYHYTPEQLTSLLYDSCLARLGQAAIALEHGEYLEVNRQLQTCHDILHRLGGGLNYEAGLIADQLEALYQYMAERLVYANVHKDRSAVLEVHKLLATIQDAWTAACRKRKDAQPVSARMRAKAYDTEYDFAAGNVNLRE
ncbi:flagellar export chaperone FliS [Gorillibacterium sp. sgz500922]|uniref:flagellar export chaperone FliS n=1 Tax=Gorillibacterium sp. sgz500922 TaxID=3446694 RepID=UPI003F673D0B